MTTLAGTPGWNLSKEKKKLTPELIEEKSKEVAERFRDMFIAYGLAVDILASEGDALGLQSLTKATEMILEGGVETCTRVIEAR